MLFRAEGMKGNIGGVILFDETIRQNAADGTSLVDIITSQGSLPGIKVDKGLQPIGDSEESLTQGLEGLDERLKEYFELGAKFTKWRAVINIGKGMPSSEAISANMGALADYAKIVQSNNMVPMVEPEVLMDGNHSIEDCYEATSRCLESLFSNLLDRDVDIKGIILKPNMVIPGSQCKDKSNAEEIAKKTLDCLKKNVPSKVPCIAFLSGGQSEIESSKNLNEINKINDSNFLITFSYGRGLQASALKEFGKNQDNTENIQKAFNHRAKMNGLSSKGEWSEKLEKEFAA